MDITAQSNSFGCCSLCRECSEQRRCLLDDAEPEHAQLCGYRAHLQAGTIFFGKNMEDFPQDRYRQILLLRESLDAFERAALDDLILFLVGRHFHLAPVLWFHSAQLDRLAELELLEVTRADRHTLDQYPAAILRKATKSKARNKTDMIAHILKEQPETVAQLCDPCRFVQIPAKLWDCYVEIYHDFLRPANRTRFTGRLPFDEEEMLVLKQGRTGPRPLEATEEERARADASKD